MNNSQIMRKSEEGSVLRTRMRILVDYGSGRDLYHHSHPHQSQPSLPTCHAHPILPQLLFNGSLVEYHRVPRRTVSVGETPPVRLPLIHQIYQSTPNEKIALKMQAVTSDAGVHQLALVVVAETEITRAVHLIGKFPGVTRGGEA